LSARPGEQTSPLSRGASGYSGEARTSQDWPGHSGHRRFPCCRTSTVGVKYCVYPTGSGTQGVDYAKPRITGEVPVECLNNEEILALRDCGIEYSYN